MSYARRCSICGVVDCENPACSAYIDAVYCYEDSDEYLDSLEKETVCIICGQPAEYGLCHDPACTIRCIQDDESCEDCEF